MPTTTFVSPYRVIRHDDEVAAYREAVTTMLREGTLSSESLVEALFTDDQCGYETIPCSIGCDIVRRNPEAFLRTVKDPLAFVENHPHRDIVALYLSSKEVFETIVPDAAQRHAFVELYFVRFAGVRQIKTLLKAGFERGYVLELVRKIFENATVSNESVVVEGGAEDIRSTLNYWVSSPLQNFSTAELLPILTIAIAKDPCSALDNRDYLIATLGSVNAITLISEAARSISQIRRLQKGSLLFLPVDVQLEILKNVLRSNDATESFYLDVEYLARLWLQPGVGQRGWALIANLLDRVKNLPDVYFGINRGCQGNIIPSALEEYRNRRFAQQSEYLLGVVAQGSYFNRRFDMNMTQLEVRIGNDLYIHEQSTSSQPTSRYFPKVGDHVMFHRPSEPFYHGSPRKFRTVFLRTS